MLALRILVQFLVLVRIMLEEILLITFVERKVIRKIDAGIKHGAPNHIKKKWLVNNVSMTSPTTEVSIPSASSVVSPQTMPLSPPQFNVDQVNEMVKFFAKFSNSETVNRDLDVQALWKV